MTAAAIGTSSRWLFVARERDQHSLIVSRFQVTTVQAKGSDEWSRKLHRDVSDAHRLDPGGVLYSLDSAHHRGRRIV